MVKTNLNNFSIYRVKKICSSSSSSSSSSSMSHRFQCWLRLEVNHHRLKIQSEEQHFKICTRSINDLDFIYYKYMAIDSLTKILFLFNNESVSTTCNIIIITNQSNL